MMAPRVYSLQQTIDELWKGAGLKCRGGACVVCVCVCVRVCVCVCVSAKFAMLNESFRKLCAFLLQATPTTKPPFCWLARTVNQLSFGS